jgi:hypothetical protein
MQARNLVLMTLAICALTLSCWAQSKNEDTNTRSVQGNVTDGSGKSAQGAVVQLKDMKTLQIRSFITQADGAYHFAGLNTNVDYELKAANQNGSESASKTLSVFDSKKTATINLKLK